IQQERFPSIYFTLDLAGMVLAVNPVGAAGWRYSAEELIAQSIFSLFHPDDRARLQVEFTALVQHPTQVIKGKFRLFTKNGRSLSVNVTVQALQGIDAKTVFLLTTEGIAEYQLVKASSQEQASEDNSWANASPVE
ncbi:MAG: PAS domain-containing protein, partial [Coleofasciculus sp. Co-bin14]|nr:PAS domain-containing protein [Coleofasciculus sp. Co-bin14]